MCQLIIMCEVLCWNTIKDTHKSWPTQCQDKRPFCRRYRMICFTSSLIRQLYHFATDFDHVLLQLLGTDIENNLFKYKVIYNYAANSPLVRMGCPTFAPPQIKTTPYHGPIPKPTNLPYPWTHPTYRIHI